MSRVLPWVMATRPRTLGISICPVLIATTLAPLFDFWIFLCTLLTALGIQITSHFANDYFDYLKGTDSQERKGFPKALVVGLISLEGMKRATQIATLATLLTGSYLVWVGGALFAWLLLLSIALALLYTGGPYPLSYLGISDLFAFAFYGPIALCGAYYLQAGTLSLDPLYASIAPGAYAASILMLNNIRDIEEDRRAGKKTFPVRFGIAASKTLYIFTMAAALFSPLLLHKLLPLLLLIPAFFIARAALTHKDPHAYHPLFKYTNFLLAAHTLLFCL